METNKIFSQDSSSGESFPLNHFILKLFDESPNVVQNDKESTNGNRIPSWKLCDRFKKFIHRHYSDVLVVLNKPQNILFVLLSLNLYPSCRLGIKRRETGIFSLSLSIVPLNIHLSKRLLSV